jgi:hypothetical protein
MKNSKTTLHIIDKDIFLEKLHNPFKKITLEEIEEVMLSTTVYNFAILQCDVIELPKRFFDAAISTITDLNYNSLLYYYAINCNITYTMFLLEQCEKYIIHNNSFFICWLYNTSISYDVKIKIFTSALKNKNFNNIMKNDIEIFADFPEFMSYYRKNKINTILKTTI